MRAPTFSNEEEIIAIEVFINNRNHDYVCSLVEIQIFDKAHKQRAKQDMQDWRNQTREKLIARYSKRVTLTMVERRGVANRKPLSYFERLTVK